MVWVLKKIEEGSEKRVVFCSLRCFRESEKLRCEKNFCKRAKFCVHVRLFKTVFSLFFFWFRSLIMILCDAEGCFNSGSYVSGH